MAISVDNDYKDSDCGGDSDDKKDDDVDGDDNDDDEDLQHYNKNTRVVEKCSDESWLYAYDPETKQQSTVWVFQNEPYPKKVIRAKSI
ncbi:hypothetical protein EVAR_33384_1 [Eumeta japonica]|uniref:Uncharacterized protein n=1 Tax=Eumeta variegata TaxID=151549 RepID=A0A4C1X0F6_EUMVA|nr:hypothetical protein EVAR_33384_1 [Eumeta japonica]